MKITLLFILLFSSVLPSISDYPALDSSARRKLDNSIKSTFQIEEFILVRENDSLNVFAIVNNDVKLGSVMIGSAMGRYEEFDFAVLYSTDWLIENVEILVYRSDHGYEVMNKKWLAQFKGSTGCGLAYGKDIDAISGATLSGNALTEAVAEFCEKAKH
jgi:uncharacterized protein with FMN-binding domain